MIIQEHISLAPYTTFKIGGPARFFCTVTSEVELHEAILFAQKQQVPFFVLGGGSNILISDEGFRGLVIKMEIMGKSKVQKEKRKEELVDHHVEIISAGAGEMWDSLVAWTVEYGLNGLENLSAIPGTVGAAPVQNIGAYGVEVGQLIDQVHAFDTQTMHMVSLSARECHFGYRNSVFKHEKGRYVVIRVDFVLRRDGKVNIEYKELKERFADALRTNVMPTAAEIREAVIDIRWHKLPDWNKWGTAGSFFKNPIITNAEYEALVEKYPGLPGFPELDVAGKSNGRVKVPLGWILDHICHAKGVRHGGVGTYEKQALVIVSEQGTTAAEVVAFTHNLMDQVKEKTGIMIEAEVEWVN